MSSLVIFEEIEKVQKELTNKLDNIKFQVAMTDISNSISSLQEKIKGLGDLNLKDIQQLLKSLSGLDESKLNELVDLLNKYKDLTNGTDTIIESKINSILHNSGVLDKFKDEVSTKLDSLHKDIVSKIKIPITLKDVPIEAEGFLNIEEELIDIMDFMVPVYSYDDSGRVMIKCMVSPKLIDGRIKIDVREEDLEKLELPNGFVGYKTSIQILTKLKEN